MFKTKNAQKFIFLILNKKLIETSIQFGMAKQITCKMLQPEQSLTLIQ